MAEKPLEIAEEEVLYFPYDSSESSVEIGEPDRAYHSQAWRDYFRMFLGNGIYANQASGLRVITQYASSVITLKAGAGFINGILYIQTSDIDFAIDEPHLTLGRKDIIVLRHDELTRTTIPWYISGEPAASPVSPDIVRNNDIYDLLLAEITVRPNAPVVTTGNILDTRPNDVVCGFVSGLIDQVDTTDLWNQYNNFLQNKFEEWDVYENEKVSQVEALLVSVRDLIQSLETQSFNLVNNNFDDWSVKRGTTLRTNFLDNGDILEQYIVRSNDLILASRTTSFLENGDIDITVTFAVWSITEDGNVIQTTDWSISNKTIFNPDGSIDSIIS